MGIDLVATLSDLVRLPSVNPMGRPVSGDIYFEHRMTEYLQELFQQLGVPWTRQAVAPLREKTGADYALFISIRDSYASAERKAAMVAMALLGVGLAGGSQVGYASLVDLRDGRLVWFNALRRGTGDLRESGSAEETLDALLQAFPAAR